MQIVNGITANKMLRNGFSGGDIIQLGKICGLSYGNLSDYDKSFLNDLKDKDIFVFTDNIVKYDSIVNGYHMKFAYANAFVSSHLILLSGDYRDNREYYYNDKGDKIILTPL
jgi:hypothetical protein